jgi:hypothetical protein
MCLGGVTLPTTGRAADNEADAGPEWAPRGRPGRVSDPPDPRG